MSDTGQSFDILWWKTQLDDGAPQRAAHAIEAGNLSNGPVVEELEAHAAERLGVAHAIATPNGSMALLMAMLALDVGPGDEVIVPSYTWIASAHAASNLGAKIVLADVERERPVIDVADVRRRITARTKAIVPVHLCGRANDVDALNDLARDNDAFVVEDACQAIMSRAPDGRCLGAIGDIGCYSLGVAKLLAAGQGGLAVTNDKALYRRMKAIKTHGVIGDGADWEHYDRAGFNFKMSDILASIALAQFDAPEARVEHVCAIHRRYAQGLSNLPGLRVSPIDLDAGEVPLWTEIETPNLQAVRDYLAGKGVQTRRVHPPLGQAKHIGDPHPCPNTDRFCDEILVLPSGPGQAMENVDRVIDLLRDWSMKLKPLEEARAHPG